MAYIGQKPATTITVPTSQSFNGDGSTTAFTLNKGVTVGEELEVFVDNVQQQPGSTFSYTATGTTLTFDEAPPTGTDNVYVIYRGQSNVNTRLEHDANAALAATASTFGDAVTVANGLTVDDDGATVLTVDRATSNGDVIALQKMMAVGSIGVNGDRLFLPANKGFYVDESGSEIVPSNGSGTNTNNIMNLGNSASTFKDLTFPAGCMWAGPPVSSLRRL